MGKSALARNRLQSNLSITKDKAMYSPNDMVEIQVYYTNETGFEITDGSMEFKLHHLENQVMPTITTTFMCEENGTLQLIKELQMPDIDFTGYLLVVDIFSEGEKLIASTTIGIDVSSEWIKFPRYGYVWDFRENVNTTERIEKLKSYHINALEYYDWKYRHHKPISENLDKWDDWSGRPIYGSTIRNYIKDAKAVNMVNMAYNMVYAATNGYEEDGVKQEWALYFAEDNNRGEGHFNFKMSDSTPTGITHLFFFDMRNKEWQEYIFEQHLKVFEAFDFDGWHGDTVGDWGKMKNAAGETLYVTDTYTEFLNAAKKVIGDKYLAFNPVGAKGIENVNKSDVDVLYTEIWPWDYDSEGLQYDSYYSLKKEIEQSRKESGGKSLVVPAYMSYDYGEKNPGSFFNTAAVMLTNATVFAAGGSRMELGDNGNMLCNEYFPAQNLVMNDELQARTVKLYDFIVAYENLLRDGQTETTNRIEFLGYASSSLGQANKVWSFGKKDENYEIIHIINLLGVSRNDWRANDGVKETPTKITNFEVKYYYSNEIDSVWMASPDLNDAKATNLSFTKGKNENGNFIQFTVPSLEYWDMIFMRKSEG
ncbi:glycoside hydrolase family 66 protein [Lederbergia graminis]|uniref:Glycoside hydrolase family 66 protein n=1 Tax=Lederbergia graminis TaxID=735518 RepID=A0ABW0LE24_9BACI